MYTYRNKNTGHNVSSETVWARLETLANWERIAGPAEQAEPAQMSEGDVLTGRTGDPDGDSGEQPEELPRPAQNAPKESWVEYVCLTYDIDEAAASAMTKAELVAYGQAE